MKKQIILIPLICFALLCGFSKTNTIFGQFSTGQLILTDDLIGEQQAFVAEKSIVANNSISEDAVIKYRAGKSIKLTRGFKVEENNSFKAELNSAASLKSDNSVLAVKLLNFEVFPNPSTGKFSVLYNTDVDFSILIYNSTGSVVYENQEITGKIEIDLSAFSKGIYFIKCNALDNVSMKKMVIN